MWELLALAAGALLAAYGFFVWRHERQVRTKPAGTTKRMRRPSASENSIRSLAASDESEHDRRMIAIGLLFVRMLGGSCRWIARVIAGMISPLRG